MLKLFVALSMLKGST